MVVLEQQVARSRAPAGGVSVRFVDALDDPAWDRKIAQFKGVTSFHTAAWCRVLKETYGFRPLYAVAEREGVLCGVLPLMEVDNFPKGRRGVSLPFTDECCALGEDAEVLEQLSGAVMAEGERRRWNYVEFRGTPVAKARAAISFYGHRLELQSADMTFARFNSAVQRAIRKGERSGVTVEITDTLEAVRAFYGLHERTRQKHGVPPQSFAFFASIHRHILQTGQGFVVLAREAELVVAAAMFFRFGDRAIYKFGASDDRFQGLRANNLVFWKAICALAEGAVTELDFGRTSLDNDGLRRFKLAWGSRESRLEYVKYDFRSKRFAEECDRASGWHTRVFSVLPRPVCRWAGAMLYRRLA
jgi:CelD/BcsL family acetyltransferase involved in cellulose biosynthesis